MIDIQDYTDLNQLLADLQKQVNLTMLDIVAPVAKETMKQEVQTEVYDVYTPKPDGYVRKKEDYGLQDAIHNMQVTPTDDGFILENTRLDWDGGTYRNVSYRVENGFGAMNKPYNKPRRFNQATLDKLADGLAQQTLKKGLISKGLQVE